MKNIFLGLMALALMATPALASDGGKKKAKTECVKCNHCDPKCCDGKCDSKCCDGKCDPKSCDANCCDSGSCAKSCDMPASGQKKDAAKCCAKDAKPSPAPTGSKTK